MSKNPARKLHSKVYMQDLYLEAHLKAKEPKHFSEVFEKITFSQSYAGKKIISAKWQKNIDGDTLPNPSSVDSYSDIIKANYDKPYSTSQKIYYSPLWVALKPGKQSRRYWLEFFRSLGNGITRSIGCDIPYKDKHSTFVKIAPAKVSEIYRYLNLDSLACLIAILRAEQTSSLPSKEMHFYYEAHIYLLLFKITEKQPFAEYRYELYQFIAKYIVQVGLNPLCNIRLWSSPHLELTAHFEELRRCLYLAKEREIVRNKADKADFLFFLFLSFPYFVSWELRNQQIIIPSDSKLESSGIAWIIRKMNKQKHRTSPIVFNEL